MTAYNLDVDESSRRARLKPSLAGCANALLRKNIAFQKRNWWGFFFVNLCAVRSAASLGGLLASYAVYFG